jgi:8-oxo-dGTP pyrophosphatase MutT (NUDIX family)
MTALVPYTKMNFYGNNQFCTNCGKEGHLYHNCKLPIMSIGVVAFRLRDNKIEYLMICRRDTLGFIDFMRGKYSIYNKDYIMNMLKQMTEEEKTKLKTYSFDELWSGIWGVKNRSHKRTSNQYHMEEYSSRDKFMLLKSGVFAKNDYYTLETLVEESYQYGSWAEPEWGFPKGRRNYQESDYSCAIREFSEETGYKTNNFMVLQNILPFEEIFTGSNYKSYKHKYFVGYFDSDNRKTAENYEVSKVEWKTYEECLKSIRYYNLEKKRMITNIHVMLKTYKYFFF